MFIQLRDKTIIVIGATGGIGRVLTREFVKAGAQVTLSARRREKLDELKSGLPEEQTLVVEADATQPEDVEEVFKKTVSHFGSVDAVVISAGTWKQLSIDEPIDEALSLAEAHFQALFLPTFVSGFIAQKIFRARGSGLIVNISSHAALRPELRANLTYGPMKAASRHFLLALRNELTRTGVRVTDIAPAIVNTEDAHAFLNTEEKRNLAVQPEDIARWIIEHFDDPHIPASQLFDSSVVL